ncbi:MAG: Zn-dependent alcohol dehydrogenase [Spirochaetaceae bacterium]|nr:MAG: Zn-dependent alcohol dehydrogenase [Spirochaetaceae bacterium]
MQAYVYRSKDSSRLESWPDPEAAEESAVIAVRMTAICGTDLRAHRYGSSSITPPRIIGHELVGEIVRCGSAVQGFQTGDRVQVAPAIGCGECRACRSGHANLCDTLRTIGFQYHGSFAPYMEIPDAAFRAGNVTLIPDDMPDDLAVLAEPVACILNSHRYLDLEAADSVAVFGAGFIGCMHAEIVRALGVGTVLMLEIDPERRRTAAQVVPEVQVLDPSDPGTPRRVAELTHGGGVDVSIVACSSGAAQRQALEMTAKLGRVSLFGGLAGRSRGFLDSNLIHYREVSVYGVHASTPQQNRDALALLQAGRLRTAAFRNNTMNLSQIDRAFELLESGAALKILVCPER